MRIGKVYLIMIMSWVKNLYRHAAFGVAIAFAFILGWLKISRDKVKRVVKDNKVLTETRERDLEVIRRDVKIDEQKERELERVEEQIKEGTIPDAFNPNSLRKRTDA